MKNKTKHILLSFDVEEFDTPLEYNRKLSLEEQFTVSFKGLNKIIDLLAKYDIVATFFTTANFANRFPDLMRQIAVKHEIASHGYFHSSFKEEDLEKSRIALEEITGESITGYRMARMMPVSDKAIKKAGYVYNASLNPTFLPGRYNNFSKPRTWFMNEEVLQIPASVTPFLRFPLFWLTFKNFSLSFFKLATNWVIKNDGYVNFYFHPWEFVNTLDKEKYGLPYYVSSNGKRMEDKLEKFIQWGLSKNYSFTTYYNLFNMLSGKLKNE